MLTPIGDAIGPRAEQVVAGWLDAARAFGAAATTIGVALFLLGSIRLVLALDEALDVIFEVPIRAHSPVRSTILGWLGGHAKALGVTMGLVVAIGAFVGLEMLLAGALRTTTGSVEHALGYVTQWLLLSVFLAATLGLLYATLPSVTMSVRDVVVAALVSAGALEVGAGALWFYFRFITVSAAYGAAGAIVVVLLWLSFSASAFILGAELSAAARRSHRGGT
jgi:membrane protein